MSECDKNLVFYGTAIGRAGVYVEVVPEVGYLFSFAGNRGIPDVFVVNRSSAVPNDPTTPFPQESAEVVSEALVRLAAFLSKPTIPPKDQCEYILAEALANGKLSKEKFVALMTKVVKRG